MAVPSERPLNELTAELVTMLGSANPVERDQTAYPVLTAWLSEGVYDDLLVSLGDALSVGLQVGLGEQHTDTVFRRSFSAVVLAGCVERDNTAHVLPVDVVLNWAERAVGWYTRERDLRGWVDDSGRAHAVAHGADLLGALAQSRHLQSAHLGVLLDVIAERLLTPTDTVFVDGEDDRLAASVLVLLQRNLVDAERLETWVDQLAAGFPRPATPAGGQGRPTASARNVSNFLRALHVHLAIGISPRNATVRFAGPPEVRADLLLALLKVIPRQTPWLYSSLALRDD